MFRSAQVGCKKENKNVLDYPRKALSVHKVSAIWQNASSANAAGGRMRQDGPRYRAVENNSWFSQLLLPLNGIVACVSEKPKEPLDKPAGFAGCPQLLHATS